MGGTDAWLRDRQAFNYAADFGGYDQSMFYDRQTYGAVQIPAEPVIIEEFDSEAWSVTVFGQSIKFGSEPELTNTETFTSDLDALTASRNVDVFINLVWDRYQIQEAARQQVGASIHGLEPRAEGGSVVGGQAYLVGERGPEVFVAGASGTIIPNHALGGGGGGISINAPIHVHGVQDVQSLYDELQKVARLRA
jgi:hypothetical protein